MARYRKRITEDRRNSRKAFGFLSLAILLFIVFITLGLPLVARVSTYVSGLRSDKDPIGVSDKTPPAPPFLKDVPEFTNKSSIKISGRSEEGATVTIYMNSSEKEVLADKDGDFQFTFGLLKGENTLSAKATDASGNESQETKEYEIVNDSENPEIVIEKPEDGASFSGNLERQLTIQGITEERATVTINERVIVVGSEGSFSYATTLSEGENVFNIKSVDRAGNETETTLSVNYSL